LPLKQPYFREEAIQNAVCTKEGSLRSVQHGLFIRFSDLMLSPICLDNPHARVLHVSD